MGWSLNTLRAKGSESLSEALTVSLWPSPLYRWPSTIEPVLQASCINATWVAAAGVLSSAPVPMKIGCLSFRVG
ncbi:hypothetical protein D3C85_1590540 [compost metagenome]